MNNKSLILKQKKLRLEYRFLIAELEEVDHILKETDKIREEKFKKEEPKKEESNEDSNQ